MDLDGHGWRIATKEHRDLKRSSECVSEEVGEWVAGKQTRRDIRGMDFAAKERREHKEADGSDWWATGKSGRKRANESV
jgi:hypothetical protein